MLLNKEADRILSLSSIPIVEHILWLVKAKTVPSVIE